jgi:lysophospholipase L1-like esterase
MAIGKKTPTMDYRPEVDGEPLYLDDDHLNARGTKLMIEAFAPRLNAFLKANKNSD